MGLQDSSQKYDPNDQFYIYIVFEKIFGLAEIRSWGGYSLLLSDMAII